MVRFDDLLSESNRTISYPSQHFLIDAQPSPQRFVTLIWFANLPARVRLAQEISLVLVTPDDRRDRPLPNLGLISRIAVVAKGIGKRVEEGEELSRRQLHAVCQGCCAGLLLLLLLLMPSQRGPGLGIG